MVIRQAMGTPKTRGADAADVLRGFVEEMKASGFVEDALRRHRIEGASMGPTIDQAIRSTKGSLEVRKKSLQTPTG
ncbi:hypothetical protein D3C86_1994380 [compost metagenome]